MAPSSSNGPHYEIPTSVRRRSLLLRVSKAPSPWGLIPPVTVWLYVDNIIEAGVAWWKWVPLLRYVVQGDVSVIPSEVDQCAHFE